MNDEYLKLDITQYNKNSYIHQKKLPTPSTRNMPYLPIIPTRASKELMLPLGAITSPSRVTTRGLRAIRDSRREKAWGISMGKYEDS